PGHYCARVRLILLGVRGSTPAPGAEFVRYGGHTSCVAVLPDGADVPTLVLDAGTGLRTLTPMLGGAAFRGSILVSHLHWDHVQGLPFFVAGDRPDSRVDLYVPEQGGRSGRDLLAAHMSPPSFPITPEGLQGEWGFHAVEDGRHDIAGFEVRATDVAHKGGRTFGYRVTDGAASLAYLPDHIVSGGVEPAVHALVEDVDVLLHDAQFVESERALADAYGHSTVADAVDLALRCRVRHLVLFHHGPARTDDALDAIAADLGATVTGSADGVERSLRVTVAAQGMSIVLPG
ncbi:MAG: MBL fold metallo-hydrolase, partial [Actinomycetes bacterium]